MPLTATTRKGREARTPPAPGRLSAPAGSRALLPALLLVVTVVLLVAWWPVLGARALYFDDQEYLLENQLVRHPGWPAVGRFFSEVLRPSTVPGYYQPLAMVSLMLDSALGGSPNRLGPFHATSLALHALNTVLVVLLLHQLFRSPLAVAWVGLLFGLHPICVEPVAWISERKTVLGTCFALAGLIAWVRYARGAGRRWYAVHTVLFILALLAKPTATPLPLVLLLMDAWPLRRLDRRVVVEKLPLFAIALASGVITYLSQKNTAIASSPFDRSPLTLLYLVSHNLVLYLGNLAWPSALSWYYPVPTPFTPASPRVLAGLVGTALLLAVLAGSWRRTRAPAIGWLIFFTAIFPTLGVIGFQTMIAADRHAYLPMIGLLLLIAWAVGRPGALRRLPRAARGIVLLGALLLPAAEVVSTRSYLAVWGDSERLYRHLLDRAPRVARLHGGLGTALAGKDRHAEAVAAFTESIRLEPNRAITHNNLGASLDVLGRVGEAVEHYQRAIALDPAYARARYNLGAALLKLGRVTNAAASFQHALRLDPGYAKAHADLGIALARQGRIDEAITHYERALIIEPRRLETLNNLAVALAARGRLEESARRCRQALALDPRYVHGHFNLGQVLQRQGRADQARACYETVLRLQPGHSGAAASLAALGAASR
jgi:tetratricopeptide (TPR) repeat protein